MVLQNVDHLSFWPRGHFGGNLPSWQFEVCKKVIIEAIDSSMRSKNRLPSLLWRFRVQYEAQQPIRVNTTYQRLKVRGLKGLTFFAN